jgi:hypothetical protein
MAKFNHFCRLHRHLCLKIICKSSSTAGRTRRSFALSFLAQVRNVPIQILTRQNPIPSSPISRTTKSLIIGPTGQSSIRLFTEIIVAIQIAFANRLPGFSVTHTLLLLSGFVLGLISFHSRASHFIPASVYVGSRRKGGKELGLI